MATIGRLALSLSADSASFTRGIQESVKVLDSLAEAASRAQGVAGNLDLSKLSDGAGGSSSPLAAAAGDADQMASQIRNSLASGLAPLSQLGARFGDQFNRLAGTMTTLARRIDASMKFPVFDSALANLQNRLEDGFAKSSVGAIRSINRIGNTLSSLGRVDRNPLDRIDKTTFARPIAGAAQLAGRLTGITPVVNTATHSVRRLGTELAAALGVFGLAYAAVKFFKDGIKGASDLTEQTSKAKFAFGDASAGIEKNAVEMARSFGIPKQQFIESASAIGLVGKASGLSQSAAAQLGSDFAKMAADVSSFHNVPVGEALAAMRSGLVGEAEPLRRFGVLLTESAVKSEAARMGIAKYGAELSEGQKIQARVSLITKGLADAQGDLARTADSPANAMRILTGRAQNLASSLGESLMPAFQAGLGTLSAFTDSMTSGLESSKSSMGSFAASVAENFGIATALIKNWPIVWDIAVDRFNLGVLKVVEFVRVIPDNMAIVGEWISNNWVNLLADGLNAAGRVFDNFCQNIQGGWQAALDFFAGGEFKFNWKPLLDGFVATTAKLPEMVRPAITSEMEKLEASIRAKSEALGKAVESRLQKTETAKPAAATVKEASAITDAMGKAAAKLFDETRTPLEKFQAKMTELKELQKAGAINADLFSRGSSAAFKDLQESSKGKGEIGRAGALELGSKEAYSAILASKGMQTSGDPIKDVAKNSKEQLAESKRLTGLAERMLTALSGGGNGGLATMPI